jgi:hypothetical protein
MVSGLTHISDAFARDLRDEFNTLTDPFVENAFRSIFSEGDWNYFQNWSKSHYTKEAHIASILKYQKEILSEPTDSAWLDVKEQALSLFRSFPKVTSRSVSQIDEVSFHEGTSAGFGYNNNPPPFPGRKGTRDQPNYVRAVGIARSTAYACVAHYNSRTFDDFITNATENSTPDIAFTRTQLAELPNTKVRNVFGEAFHYILLEGLSAEPLLKWFMNNDTFYYIGHDPLIGVPNLLSLADDSEATYLSIDWSAFDASAQPYEIELAFDLLHTMLTFQDKESELVFKYVRALFIKRKLLSPDGRIFMRTGGVPSGSYFTHMIDSIINWNRIRYLLTANNIMFKLIKTHGDDGFVQITSTLNEFHYISEQAARLGWYLQPEKCMLTTDLSKIEFLGRYSEHGANQRNRLKCLRLCLYPEYPVTDPQTSLARLKSIYIDSGGYISEIPQAVEILTHLHGDMNLELPREFKRFNPTDRTRTEGI